MPQFLLLSSAAAPWLPGNYLAAKRAAEQFLSRSGMRQAIVRAPLAYEKGKRPFFFRFLSALAWVPRLGNASPLPVDQLARGVAQLALQLLREEAGHGRPRRQLPGADLPRARLAPFGAGRARAGAAPDLSSRAGDGDAFRLDAELLT